MRDYDSWLTEFLDYEDDDLTDEEREELKDLYDAWVIDQYEQNKLD
jgi:mannosyltransferase OCH1-like enzyme